MRITGYRGSGMGPPAPVGLLGTDKPLTRYLRRELAAESNTGLTTFQELLALSWRAVAAFFNPHVPV